MNEKADAQLLRDYTERGDESAFRELVLRHTDLLYSSAMRQLESPDLACDVVQSAFCDLARKARQLNRRLEDQASLLGWLYRSVRFLALNQLRYDRRRQARERQAMEDLDLTCASAAEWDRVRSLLDEAMADLPDDDREALLLRFFKNDDYHAVGAALGVSDDTAQKRVSRALEKLRAEFSRRGVTTTAVALTAAVSANAVTIAPAGLAASATGAALAGVAASAGTGLTLFRLLPMTKPTTVVVCALITAALVTPLVVQRQSINRLELESARLRFQQVAAPPNNSGPPAQPTADAKLLAQFPEEHLELLRLRGQVGVLRRELASIHFASQPGLTSQSNSPRAWLLSRRSPALTSDQAEAYVKKSGRTPDSLLGAYFASHGDAAFLREAMDRYPGDPKVALMAMTDDQRPNAHRQWVDRLKESAPDNALAHYPTVSDYLEAGQTEQALLELQMATGKAIFDDYFADVAHAIEEAYRSAGYSETESKAAEHTTVRGGLLVKTSFADKLIEVAVSYRQAGDAASAQAVLERGLTLGKRLAQPSTPSLPHYGLGLIIEARILGAMDPNSLVGGSGQTARALLEENAQRSAALQVLNEHEKESIALVPEGELPGFLDLWRTSGGIPALQWLESKWPATTPTRESP